MNKVNSKVFVIDDDKEILSAYSLLLKSAGYKVECFNGIDQFLERENYNGAGCILLDVFLGDRTGLELQEEIESKFECLPIVFITGHGNIPMSVEAIKKGAVNFLQKPVDEKDLFSAMDEAINRSNFLITKYNEVEKFKSLVNALTAREYEIFTFVITGLINKQIAVELGIAEHTVKNHRLKITEKLGVKSVPEMIYIAEKLNIQKNLI
jgi:FixJ family two-component response regulator